MSAAPHFLGELRQAVRRTNWAEAQELARTIEAAKTPGAVRALLGRAQDELHRRCVVKALESGG